MDFAFSLSENDNIFCDNQEIEINEKAKSINILGFSYWGDNYEKFKIVYSDNTTENIKVVLPDWSHGIENASNSIQLEASNNNIKTGKIFLSSGRIIHMIYFHQFKFDLKSNKLISKIILPENMFMHIFAITLEE